MGYTGFITLAIDKSDAWFEVSYSLSYAYKLWYNSACMYNWAHIVCRFEWLHPNIANSGIFSVQPSCGIILPNEIQVNTFVNYCNWSLTILMQVHKWCFSPHEPIEYELKSVLHYSLNTVNKLQLQCHVKSKALLEICGTGATGSIKVRIQI